MNRLRRLRRDESGMTYVFIGMSMMAFLGASMLAIDVGMLMTARGQAQNAADAGALAGATALVFDNYEDRSASGPAVVNAMTGARANAVIRDVVSVTSDDVTFPTGPTGQANRVQVNVFRHSTRGNPVSTLVAGMLNVLESADVTATATAEASPANAMNCVMPFTIPDQWIERQTPPWDPDDTFDLFDKKGKPLPNPDIYIPSSNPNYTGYNAMRDKGLPVVLKASNSTNISPSFYFPWAIPGSTGADDYEWNIANCNQTIVGFNELLTPEPGNMVGPTESGIEARIAKDPSAYWDNAANKVVSDMKPSPRVIIIPLFDPVYYETGKQNSRNADIKAVNYLGFFIESMRGGDVIGRVTPVSGLLKDGYGPAPTGAFPMAIRLVK